MSERSSVKKEETKEPIRISLFFENNEDSPDANENAGTQRNSHAQSLLVCCKRTYTPSTLAYSSTQSRSQRSHQVRSSTLTVKAKSRAAARVPHLAE